MSITTVFCKRQPDLSKKGLAENIAAEAMSQESDYFRGYEIMAEQNKDQFTAEQATVKILYHGNGESGRLILQRQWSETLGHHVDVNVSWRQ